MNDMSSDEKNSTREEQCLLLIEKLIGFKIPKNLILKELK